MPIRFPDDLPRTLAFLAGPPVVAFMWVGTAAESALSMGSSTSGLGYPFGLIYGSLAAGGGLLAGNMIRLFFPRGAAGMRVPLPLVGALVLGLTAAGGLLGRETARRAASVSEPAILTDLDRLEPIAMDDSTDVGELVGTLLGGGSVADSMTWNERPLRVVTDTTHLYLTGATPGDTVTVPLPGLGKPFRIDVATPRIDGGQSTALVMMVIGSLRRDRAMLVAVDPTWHVIYQERLIRRWDVRLPTLARWRGENGDPVAIRVGPNDLRMVRVTSH